MKHSLLHKIQRTLDCWEYGIIQLFFFLSEEIGIYMFYTNTDLIVD